MQKRPAAFLAMLFLAHGMPGQMIRSFPLENSRNPNAQVQLPWLETGDSMRNEAVNKRLWEHMLWGHAALGPDWADSGCAAVLRDLHDTMHGLQDAYTEVLWENDTLISFATHAEWLGTYLSHSLHRVTLHKKSGGSSCRCKPPIQYFFFHTKRICCVIARKLCANTCTR